MSNPRYFDQSRAAAKGPASQPFVHYRHHRSRAATPRWTPEQVRRALDVAASVYEPLGAGDAAACIEYVLWARNEQRAASEHYGVTALSAEMRRRYLRRFAPSHDTLYRVLRGRSIAADHAVGLRLLTLLVATERGNDHLLPTSAPALLAGPITITIDPHRHDA